MKVLTWMPLAAFHFVLYSFSAAQAQTTADPVRIPLHYENSHMVAELNDEQLGRLRLLVDTGAENTLLALPVAQKTQIRHHWTDHFYSFYGFGSGKKAKLQGHATLHLTANEARLGTLPALVVGKEQVSIGLQPELNGILGWDFFRDRCVALDVKAEQMRIPDPEQCAPREEGFYTPTVKWMKEGMILPITATVAGRPPLLMKLHVDTGSSSILLNPHLRAALGMEKTPQGKTENRGDGVNGSFDFDIAYAATLSAPGGHPKIEGRIPLLVPRKGFSQPRWFTAGRHEAELFQYGVLGNSFLSNYLLIFDGRQKKLYERAYSYMPK